MSKHMECTYVVSSNTWLWDSFVDELQDNFGPFNESADIEHDHTNLRMKDTQCISNYLVHFNSLAVRCSWGESALQYRFYEGLLARLEDEISKGDGKLKTLAELRRKAQSINTHYWECVQEHSWEQSQHLNTTQKTLSSTPQSTSKPAPTTSRSTSQASGSKPSKPKEALKQQSTKPDLKGHKVQDCILRKNAAKARASSTVSTSSSTPAQGKDSASESKKL